CSRAMVEGAMSFSHRSSFSLCFYGFQRSRWESSDSCISASSNSSSELSSIPRNLQRNALYAGKGLEMARIYQSRAWDDQMSPSLEELEFLAMEIYANLPEAFRKLTGEIVIQMAEFPTEEIMDDLALESPFDLLGLFEGRGIAERWNPDTGVGPNRITLYRRAILDYWSENEETLGDIVTHVLIHEIGHHFGLSDDDMVRIEDNADDGYLSASD